MRSLLLCLAVLAGATGLDAGSVAHAAPVALRSTPVLAIPTATDGALVDTVQYYPYDRRGYREHRREWQHREAMRRRAEARRWAEWRHRNGYR